MGKYKRKTEFIKIHDRKRENVNWRLETAESKRSVAKDFGVPESAMGKKLKDKENNAFSRSLQGYVFKCGEINFWLLQGFRRNIPRYKGINLWLCWDEMDWWQI